MAKRRADQLLVERGLAPSRSRAAALIMSGEVFTDNDVPVRKPGENLAEDAALRVRGEQLKYVSRGGLKLEAALSHFKIHVADKVCLDIGASTGGFTDCLLQHGARQVFAVDVGYGQLHWRLRQDPRVTVIERFNIRDVTPEVISTPCEIVVVDVSFISLRLVVPSAKALLAPGASLIALIKPQFEVGKSDVGKGGIVRDPQARERACQEVETALGDEGFDVHGRIPSPIEGAKGNREFLVSASLRA